MSHASLLEQQRHILRELTGLVTERARLEPEIEATFQQRTAAAEREYQQITQRLAGRHEAERDAAETEYHQTRRRVLQKFDADQATAQKQREDALHQLEERYRADTQKAERQHQETRWQIDTIYEARKTEIDKVVQRSKDEQEQIKHLLEAVQANHRQAQAQLLAWGRARIAARVEKIAWDEPPDENPLQQLEECAEAIEERLEELKDLRAPRWARPSRLLGLAVGLWLVAASPAVWVLIARPTGGLSWKHWLAAGTATALGLVLIIGTSLTALAKAQLRRHYRPICRAWADARVFARRGRERVTARLQQAFEDKVQAKKRRAADRQQADEKARALQADLKQRYHVDRAATEEKFARLLLAQQEERDRDLRQAEEKYQRTLAEVEQRFQDDSRTVQQKYERFLHETRSRYERDRQGLVQRWTEGTSRLRETLARLRAEVDRLFPQWHDPAWNSWKPPVVSPQVLRIGELAVRGHDLVDAPAIDEHSPLGPVPAFAMPALLDFPRQASLLFKAREVGRAEAVAALQMVMFRLLTSLPPGRARLTIIDPVGRGENFAAFMHLADHLEALVSSKIWTEHAHIDQRLADLTAHMENVIQKYLRNQYQTIEEYNAQAGEVAEPYRFLVVADFPVNFSAEAARRLISIASSGARCGVFTLVSVDARQPLPEGCQLQDLEACSSNFVWKDGNFRWKDETFGRFPLRLDPPPEPEFATRILHVVGAEAKRASRVEVSFDFLAPKEDEWWTSDSRAGIYVPLGRAGATKRQALSLGQGTSQHVLIAGKTGSGKSTLLHVLITNLSLLYSPDEVELYLIDFKKGVEFKQYASLELPHARVVAIESEREFGLSVLQRLDAELKIRGERFRQLGVQNIQDFRDAGGGRCPRILLIVDEFQEFFVEDDKIAQDAALLFDRLVRQGRAFGLHVLLGSQTLGGAYSLARSTIDQMAVRIALQCSEADGYLILSKDNPAARLLSRPGEAIYNDANGLVEGNNIFQVVWLSDERREQYLRQLHDRAKRSALDRGEPQIVFEGNAPADVTKNRELAELLTASTWPEGRRSFRAWVGEAIAIKEPTCAVFEPQRGGNLLMVGQQDEAALGILTTALLSLAAQHSPAEARFYVLDGTPQDDPRYGFWRKLLDVVPHPLTVVGWRDLARALGEVADEVDRRQKTHDVVGPAVYLFIHGLHRFRDLRKSDDDFIGFSRRGEERVASPSKMLGTILHEGPNVGVSTFVWGDTLNNIHRYFDRQGLRDFEMRVLFQMGVADSSNLIDSPAASKLGPHRALFYSEDLAQPEKFRPYSPAADDWLDWVRCRLRSRAGVLVGQVGAGQTVAAPEQV